MILRNAWLLAAYIATVWADVEFVTPAAGSSQASLTLAITWKDSGDSPALSALTSYDLYLCAGGNSVGGYADLTQLVSSGTFSTGNSVSATVTTGLGANVANAYFLKMVSKTTGGSIVNFSSRFSLTGMTGVFSSKVTAGLKTVSGTAGPATIKSISDVDAGDASTTDTDLYTTPYTLQTGTIRYAPMPPMPVTSITAKGASAQWPTSAYTLYTTYAGTPNAVTTNTLEQTFSTSSREATQSAAGQPTDTAMRKYLNRWKD